jgi:hypothetical protein
MLILTYPTAAFDFESRDTGLGQLVTPRTAISAAKQNKKEVAFFIAFSCFIYFAVTVKTIGSGDHTTLVVLFFAARIIECPPMP